MNWFATGSAFAGSGVLLGAFAAHSLQSRLTSELLTVFETAVRYQMWHALALLLVFNFPKEQCFQTAIGCCFTVGVLLFSGSLYWLALGGPKWLWPVTPIGGLLLIFGWLLLLVSSCKTIET